MFRTPSVSPPDDDDTADLIPVASLIIEGLGSDSPYITSPRAAVDALAAQVGDAVVLDSVGRRCVTRATAQQLFAAQAEAEQRQREAHRRREVESPNTQRSTFTDQGSRRTESPTASHRQPRCCRPPKTPNPAANPCSSTR